MSVVPLRDLSARELARLGNNASAPPRRRSRCRRQVQAVNRSLARLGERIGTLHPRLPAPLAAV